MSDDGIIPRQRLGPTHRAADADFVSLDVETANSERASICQIGIVAVCDGQLVSRWKSLVDPECEFGPEQTLVHGITADDVEGSPTFEGIFEKLVGYVDGNVVVSYSQFDKAAIEQSLDRYGLRSLRIRWLDAMALVRRTWPLQFGWSNYGLETVAAFLGIEYAPHDGLEDAIAAAKVINAVREQTGLTVAELPGLARARISADRPPARTSGRGRDPTRAGSCDGPLVGQTFLFTGQLGMARSDVADRVAHLGANVVGNASKKVTICVVADLDAQLERGELFWTGKHHKMQSLIDDGHTAQIISGAQFFELIDLA